MPEKVLRDAKKALKAILEFYSEDAPQVKAQKRVIEYLTIQTKGK